MRIYYEDDDDDDDNDDNNYDEDDDDAAVICSCFWREINEYPVYFYAEGKGFQTSDAAK